MRSKLLLAASILLCAQPALAVEKRVYKIDSVVAIQKAGRVVIQVNGAVQSGGWKGPRLHVIPGDNNRTLTVEFVATAPPPGFGSSPRGSPLSALKRRVGADRKST